MHKHTPPSTITPLIAVLPEQFGYGVNGTDTDSDGKLWLPRRTYDDGEIDLDRRGSGPNDPRRAVCEVGELGPMLGRVWSPLWALAVTYVIFGPDGLPLPWQPRLNKPCLEHMRAHGYFPWCRVVMIDVDFKLHATDTWTPDKIAAFETLRAAHPMLQGLGFYPTPGGYRAIQILDRWVEPEQHEAHLRWLIPELNRCGIKADTVPKNWNSMFNLPNIYRKRGGVWIHTHPLPWPVSLDGILQVTPRITEEQVAKAKYVRNKITLERDVFSGDVRESAAFMRAQRKGILRGLVRTGPQHGIWCPLKKHTSTALDKTVMYPDGSFNCYSDDECAKASQSAFDAAIEALPDVYTPPETDTRLTVSDARVKVDSWYAGYIDGTAPEGIQILAAPPGVGKSLGADVMAEARAALNKRTGFATPTNKLGIEKCRNLTAMGVPWNRIFSQSSLLDSDGNYVCKYAGKARNLQLGGLSVRAELCDGGGSNPCQYRNDCRAYIGMEGDPNALITIGTHDNVTSVIDHIGLNGVLVVDELRNATNKITVYIDEVKAFQYQVDTFEKLYIDGLTKPSHVVQQLALENVGKKQNRIIDPSALMKNIVRGRDLYRPGHKGGRTPDVKRAVLTHARQASNDSVSAILGEKSRTAMAIQRLYDATLPDATDEQKQVGLLFDTCKDSGMQQVTVLTIDQQFEAIVKHRRTAYTGADLRRQVPVIERMNGSMDGRVESIEVQDTCKVSREHFVVANATKKGMYRNDQPYWGDKLERVAMALFAKIACRMPGKVLFVSNISVSLHMRLVMHRILRTDDTLDMKKALATGIRDDQIESCWNVMGPILSASMHKWNFAWYGDSKGTNEFSDYDGCVTFMDPWAPMDEVALEHEFATGTTIDLEQESTSESIARDLIWQAEGRLRLCGRSKDAWIIRAGKLLSSDKMAWRVGDYVRTEYNRTSGRQQHTRDYVVVLNSFVVRFARIADAARCVGVSYDVMKEWRSGKRAVPVVYMNRINELLRSGTK